MPQIRVDARYELVQAYRPKLCPPRMPHAIATRMSHIYCSIILTAMNTDNTGSDDILVVRFFVQDFGMALSVKMCPNRPQAFKKVNNGQVFSLHRKLFFFSERANFRYSKACLSFFHTSI